MLCGQEGVILRYANLILSTFLVIMFQVCNYSLMHELKDFKSK